MLKLFLPGVVLLFFSTSRSFAQEKLTFTLEETVSRARLYSSTAISARHAYRSVYWSWRSFKADQLPSVSFTSAPSLNRSIQALTMPDGSDSYVHRDLFTLDGSLSISQNVPFTGGRVYIQSALQRIDLFSDQSHAYKSTPLIVGYSQNIFGYNSQKWQRKIEPLRYEEGKKNYIEAMEQVSRIAVLRFFTLAVAQTAWGIARDNYDNAEMLYRIGEGRYEKIGTITENDILQLEINKLNAQTNMINARMEVDDCMFELRSYLGITDDIEIEVIPDENVPIFLIDEHKALEMAMANNAQILSLQRQAIESERAVVSARAQRFQVNFFMEFGLSQSGNELQAAYQSPLQQQVVRAGFTIPILDWGVGKGRVKMAESNRDRTRIEIEQNRTDFQQNVLKMVKQFNLQANKIAIAHKTNEIAQRHHDVTQKLFLSEKSTMLELNSAISEKDNARRNYINSIYQFWSLFYNLRALTGFDFQQEIVITEDFHMLIQ